MSRDFEQAVARARVIEQAVAAWLMRRRCQILPVYDYSGLGKGKAPKLAGASRSLVTPDLLVAREGMTTWVEVKWKTSATLHKTSGSVDIGVIERRLWGTTTRRSSASPGSRLFDRVRAPNRARDPRRAHLNAQELRQVRRRSWRWHGVLPRREDPSARLFSRRHARGDGRVSARRYTAAELAQEEPLVRSVPWDHPRQTKLPGVSLSVSLSVSPLRLASSANVREHHMARARRVAALRHVIGLAVRVRAPRGMAGCLAKSGEAAITICRVAPRALDDDNLVSAAKPVRDSIAAFLGLDDRSQRMRWSVTQERGAPKEYAVRISIEVSS